MNTKIKTGSFVHVVAIIDLISGEGTIRYVNPANSAVASDAPPEKDVELAIFDRQHRQLFRTPVIVRRSSPEPDRSNAVGLIQAYLPRMPGTNSVALIFKGKEISRYEGGEMPEAKSAGARFALALAGDAADRKRSLAINELAGRPPAAGVTYSVQVKPDNGGYWHTIAVGRPTPEIVLDRNQFAGANKATIRVLRTTGFEEEIVAEDTVDFK
jgi:hypothetical protein